MIRLDIAMHAIDAHVAGARFAQIDAADLLGFHIG